MDKVRGLILFGDSVLAGTGASDRQLGCAKLIKQTLPIPVSIKSRNRDSSRTALRRIGIDVLEQRELTHVVILFGNNDSWLDAQGKPDVPLEEFEENLKRMACLIRDNDQTPLLCDLQPIDNLKFFRAFPQYINLRDSIGLDPNSWQERYSNLIRSVSNAEHLELIEIRRALNQEILHLISDDGIHPNNRGHDCVAQTILKTLHTIDLTLSTPALRSRLPNVSI